jgi:hypothetical protein
LDDSSYASGLRSAFWFLLFIAACAAVGTYILGSFVNKQDPGVIALAELASAYPANPGTAVFHTRSCYLLVTVEFKNGTPVFYKAVPAAQEKKVER